MTVHDEIYPDANEEVKFGAFQEKLSEHNQCLLSIWGCTSLADAVTHLHNHETRETKDNSSLDSQADASSTSAMVTKKSRLELTPVVAGANPTDAHLVNLQATMQKLVEEIKGIKQTQVSVTHNSRPASQRCRFPLSQLPFHPANLCHNPNVLPLPLASHAALLQWLLLTKFVKLSGGAGTSPTVAATNNGLTSTSISTDHNWWYGYYSPLHAEDLGEPSLLPYTGPQVVGVGGVFVAIQGIATVDILVVGTPVHGCFLMAPQLPSPVLVDMDILSVFGAVIDFKSQTPMAKLTIPVHLQPRTTGCVHIVSMCVIPAYLVAYVHGFTNFGPVQDMEVLITPKDRNGNYSGYWVAHSLARTKIHDGRTAVYVSMNNLTDEDVKLHASQCIASLEVYVPNVSTVAFDEHCTVAAVADIPGLFPTPIELVSVRLFPYRPYHT
ncbi:hypothetical protein QOT17_018775 [Balamuthia mandrillaris]